jgi:uncharacterized protein (DUF885 family)
MSRQKLPSFLTLLLFPALFFLLFSGCIFLNNRSFQRYTDDIFRKELSGNTLSLHYTLKNPETYGITDVPVTLGNAEPEALAASSAVLENYNEALSRFPYPLLSRENRLTYDILELYFQNQLSGAPFTLYAEPLGPTIGTQAQLPVLLAEYAFHNKSDVETYLKLLQEMDSYYATLLHFEQAKSKAGLFMSRSSAEAILDQCRSFIETPEENVLITLFPEKLQQADFLTQAEKKAFEEANRSAVLDHVIPAYRLLIRGLTALKDTGNNQQGLFYLPEGKTYYEYLLRDSTGSYASVPAIEKRIQSQLQQDFQSLRLLADAHPELLTRETLGSAIAFTLDNSPSTIFNTADWYSNAPRTKARAKKALEELTPDEILNDLKQKIASDFPVPPEAGFSVKYVHPSLEPYLSPAFYLTPPIDDLTENTIYINQSSTYSPLDLYTTLAHEGYPGHLYQTIFHGASRKNPVRELLNFGGYVEGWATYVEMYSYGLPDMDRNLAELYRLNRSLTLGLSSLMDIQVHYRGFSREQTASYLANFGLERSSANALYDALLEAPANYLKYYLGYLSFLDLKDAYEKNQGTAFSLKKFHQKILEIGPAPFPVLSKYLLKQ